jgi:hypothetical protein
MVKETQNKTAERPEANGGCSGRNLRDKPIGVSNVVAGEDRTGPETMQLMEAVVERSNMTKALH